MGTRSPTLRTERTDGKRSGTKTIDKVPPNPPPRRLPLLTAQALLTRAFKHARMSCLRSVGVKMAMRLTTGCKRRGKWGRPSHVEASGPVGLGPTSCIY